MHYYEQYARGEITIEELRQHQANALPRCINHPGRPAHGVIPDGPVCEECGAAWVLSREYHLKAQPPSVEKR